MPRFRPDQLVRRAQREGREVWARKIRMGESTHYAMPDGEWGIVRLTRGVQAPLAAVYSVRGRLTLPQG